MNFRRLRQELGTARITTIGWLSSKRPRQAHPRNASIRGKGPAPILIVGADGRWGEYLAEILGTEGLTCVSLVDTMRLTADVLALCSVVLLCENHLEPSRVHLLERWMLGGGVLVAMRPSASLVTLFGVRRTGMVVRGGCLVVDTTKPPGEGITGRPVRVPGEADAFALAGAEPVAWLKRQPDADSVGVAVSIHHVGEGEAAAFAYELPRSVALSRQGDPSGRNRPRGKDGPQRPADLFPTPPSSSRLVNDELATVPHADEHARLLVNLILFLLRDRLPLPRLWYLPDGLKAVVVMTADNHARGDIGARLKTYRDLDNASASPIPVRSSVYLSINMRPEPGHRPLSDEEASSLQASGFEIALHVDTGCADWSPSTLEYFYRRQLREFRRRYPSISAPTTVRTHCVAWSDWGTQPRVEQRHGIDMDLNYYPPADWVRGAAFLTGSALPMRFATNNGHVLDVVQAATHMNDEAGQPYPATIDAFLDAATGEDGFYGAYVANVHIGREGSNEVSREIVTSALSRGVPIISARQLSEWIRARDRSSATPMGWDGHRLMFEVVAPSVPIGSLWMMLPRHVANRTLDLVTRDDEPVSYTTDRRKGVEYAMFPVKAGMYHASYASTDAHPDHNSLEEEMTR